MIEGVRGFEFDRPRDECGIVVVVSPNYDAARFAALGVTELRNRGHEMTGIVTDRDDRLLVSKGFGTGGDLFPDGGYDYNFANPSRRAMAHARYSTQGTQDLEGAQPHALKREIFGRDYSLAHIENGNLTNTHDLAAAQGLGPHEYVSDNDLMAHTFMNNIEALRRESPDDPLDVKKLMRRTLPMFEGAFTCGLMLDDVMVVYNDHHGLKPGVIGQLPNGGIMVASEITALEAAEATVIRHMNPGEMIIIQNDGSWEAEQWAVPEPKRCVLEVLYVHKPRTRLGTPAEFGGIAIEEARRNAGEALASVLPIHADGSTGAVEADFGFGLPNSGVPVGQGFCDAKGLPYNPIAVTLNRDGANRKIETRSFIAPDQDGREQIVKQKLRPDPQQLQEKVVEVGDDSLIRGTVARKNGEMLRGAGATEVHMRIGAPMILFTCELGIDLGRAMELLAGRAAAKLGIDLGGGYDSLTPLQIAAMQQEICIYTGIDSIAFLTPELLREKVLGEKAGEFCMKCMTGEMPGSRPTVVLVELTSKSE